MSDTLVCHDAHLDRDVVVKSLKAGVDPKRLLDELAALSAIRSKHVVQVYDVVRDAKGSVVAFVEEYLNGSSLEGVPPPKNSGDAIALLYPIAHGIHDIHSHNRVHRDIKPGNMRRDSEGCLKIYDFGLAKLHVPTGGTQNLYFTPGYTAPEAFHLNAKGEYSYTAAVDVYAFGVTALQLLSGVPLSPDLLQVPPKTDNCDFAKLSQKLPTSLCSLLNDCLESNPNLRPSMGEIKHALGRHLLFDKHRATLILKTKPNFLSATNRTAKFSFGDSATVTVHYDGLEFKVTQVDGPVFINNMPVEVDFVLPGACIIVMGARAWYVSWHDHCFGLASRGDSMNAKILKEKVTVGGRYRIAGWLGEGGMQQVYRAQDQLLSREVALKVPKDTAAEKRFKRSATVSARINHNNVAKTLDYFEEADRPYLIEEIIEGEDLGQIVKVIPNMPPQAAARILHQLAKGVAASHHAGVVHRDLKPSNIMVEGGIRLDAVKITDFGIAKMAEEELAKWAEGEDKTAGTSSKTVMGAVPYMAPESITSFRKAGMPSDVWAIAAIVYELLAGKKPYGQGLGSIQGIMSGKLPPKPVQFDNPEFGSLGEEIGKIIRRCFEPAPEKRPTAEQLVKDCETLCYTRDSYEMGHVKLVKNSMFGFLSADDGEDAFYHRSNFYGDNQIKIGDRVWFARHPGGGNDRAFPIVKLGA
jgi:serine/threonine protein kinase